MFNYKMVAQDQIEYHTIIAEEEVPEGQQIFFTLDDLPMVIFNIVGTYYAIADQCSHDGGPVGEGDLTGTEIKCPRHGARFDLNTGKALSMPATVDIPAYPVRIENGQIQVGVPKK